MNLKEKIEKGTKYLVAQCEQKLNALGSFEGSVFKPTNPKEWKKHKANMEFRLRFSEAVDELLKQHILLSEGVLEMVSQLEKGEISEEDLKGLKDYATKFETE